MVAHAIATGTCQVSKCKKKHFGKGFCSMNYQRKRKHGDPSKTLKPSHCLISLYVNRKYGKLTILEEVESKIYNYCKVRKVRCLCDCGSICIVSFHSVIKGISKSCGCLHKETVTKHGKSNSRSYKIWAGMIDRCENPSNDRFYRYGKLGVSKRWHDFNKFYSDMGDPPDGMSLDRINNNKGYSKENCRWATGKDQQRNRKSNRIVKFKGKTQCIAAWADELNMSWILLYSRIKRGWSIERAFYQPKKW